MGTPDLVVHSDLCSASFSIDILFFGGTIRQNAGASAVKYYLQAVITGTWHSLLFGLNLGSFKRSSPGVTMNERHAGLIVAPTLAQWAWRAQTSEIAQRLSLATSFASKSLILCSPSPNLDYVDQGRFGLRFS